MQKITDGLVVSLNYILTVDGETLAQTDADDPMEYLHGAEEILPGLERALDGKQVGDKFSVTLQPEDAYGDYDDEDVEEIDRADIPNVDELDIGMVVEVEDEDGYAYMAQVREIGDKVVTLDFNPPLAGKTLTYDVEVMAIREATAEELEHGHSHGEDWDEEDEDDYEYEDENEE
ncbi:MAG: peptidylprolyl isomerase [Chloroflexi bacterium]|nr:peptidylprolyl isomerase [Chloroflexota bacterium]